MQKASSRMAKASTTPPCFKTKATVLASCFLPASAELHELSGLKKGELSTLAMMMIVSTKAIPAPSRPKGDRKIESSKAVHGRRANDR